MSKDNRLSKLENAAGGGGPGDDVTVIVDWDEYDNITGSYVVDGVKMSEVEFQRRWPNWKPGNKSVVVNWD